MTPAKSHFTLHPMQQKYLLEHTRCPMCESELELEHSVDEKQHTVQEKAHCPDCGVRARDRTYDLQ